jgi:hypothetical protein
MLSELISFVLDAQFNVLDRKIEIYFLDHSVKNER